jgi:hypothetical protein
MNSYSTKRQRRAADLSRRLRNPIDARHACAIFGCPNPTRAASGRGLNRLYCRSHEDRFQRHGSYVKDSYSGGELRPYRTAAERWIKGHESEPLVRGALVAVEALLRAGRPEEAFRLRGLSPADRARVAWGRLRVAKVSPVRLLAAWLAVELRLADDPQPDWHPEYKQVQAAKVIHRMASGTHKRWEQERSGGQIHIVEMHKYPASRGRVLRHLGKALGQAAELVVAHHLAEIRSSLRASVSARP